MNKSSSIVNQRVIKQKVRLEEVTTASECVAFFDASIESIVNHFYLPIYESYDDTDDLRFAFFTLASEETVILVEYPNSAQPGTSLYVDPAILDIPQIVFDSCQQLQVWRKAIWFHPDFLESIKQLYKSHGQIRSSRYDINEPGQQLLSSQWYETIDCLHHALRIYSKKKFPQLWARLKYKLGLAYADRVRGYRFRNLKQSIDCFNKSLEIYTRDDFPEKWELVQHALQESQRSLDLLQKENLVKNILEQPIPDRNLIGINLSGVDLSGANLSGAKLNGANLNGTELNGADLRLANLRLANLRMADLSGADLSGADLSGTNLSGTNLKFADLSGVSLSNAKVAGAKLGCSYAISEAMKQDLINRGCIFDDFSCDRSNSRMIVPF